MLKRILLAAPEVTASRNMRSARINNYLRTESGFCLTYDKLPDYLQTESSKTEPPNRRSFELIQNKIASDPT